VAAALWAGRALWDHYELSPWTRDGRVRVNVVQLAPDVAGLITQVPVHDNQAVKAGELLFAVDHARYALALREAEAALAAARPRWPRPGASATAAAASGPWSRRSSRSRPAPGWKRPRWPWPRPRWRWSRPA
jgi:multidrug resistance efflux pump